jgi:tetratricopeptide (TPR) repeat protein
VKNESSPSLFPGFFKIKSSSKRVAMQASTTTTVQQPDWLDGLREHSGAPMTGEEFTEAYLDKTSWTDRAVASAVTKARQMTGPDKALALLEPYLSDDFGSRLLEPTSCILYSVASLLYLELRRFGPAVRFASKAADIARQAPLGMGPQGELVYASRLGNLAFVQTCAGHHQESAAVLFQMLGILEGYPALAPIGAQAKLCLGADLTGAGQHRAALTVFEEAAAHFAKEEPHSFRYAYALAYSVSAARKVAPIDKALGYQATLVRAFCQCASPSWDAFILAQIGQAYCAFLRYDKAFSCFAQALAQPAQEDLCVSINKCLRAATEIAAVRRLEPLAEHAWRMCGQCNVIAKDILACTGCLREWYCSPECQLKDWPAHRLRCDACYFCNAAIGDKHIAKCGACRRARYCNADCQKRDWRYHKQECRDQVNT